MDGILPTPQPPNQRAGINFVGIIILVLLIPIILVLNYFNILPLSQQLPNQLGFLPRRDIPTGTSQQLNNVTIPPTTAASLLEPAKQTLNNILPNILVPSLIPNSPEAIKTQSNQMATSFTSTWTTNESTATAILVVTPDGKGIDQIHLSFQKDQSIPPSINTAPILASAFFSVKPKGIWGCKPLSTSIDSIIYCENFWEEDGTKKGIGVEGLFTQGPALVNKSPITLIFFCQRSKNNKLYIWKSCRSEFAESGVK